MWHNFWVFSNVLSIRVICNFALVDLISRPLVFWIIAFFFHAVWWQSSGPRTHTGPPLYLQLSYRVTGNDVLSLIARDILTTIQRYPWGSEMFQFYFRIIFRGTRKGNFMIILHCYWIKWAHAVRRTGTEMSDEIFSACIIQVSFKTINLN